MSSSSLNFVDNLATVSHKIKCKYEHGNKICATCGIKYKGCDFCFEYINVKDDLIEYKCLRYNRNYQKAFDDNLKKRFVSRYNFLTTISIILLCYCKKIFIYMNIWNDC